MNRVIAALIAPCASLALLLLVPAPPAHAGEADDLQNMIDRSRRVTEDLRRMDTEHQVSDEIALLSTWLDEAWRLRGEQKFDETRPVIERCDSQADMIREKITAAKAEAEAQAKEAAVRRSRANVDKTKQALHDAQMQKARLEGKQS